jgi:hypothetical protein
MEPSGDPSRANPPISFFEASDVPWELETEKTVNVNYTIENTLLPRI